MVDMFSSSTRLIVALTFALVALLVCARLALNSPGSNPDIQIESVTPTVDVRMEVKGYMIIGKVNGTPTIWEVAP